MVFLDEVCAPGFEGGALFVVQSKSGARHLDFFL